MTTGPEDRSPRVTVRSGAPTDDEVAAVVAVIAELDDRAAEVAPQRRPGWQEAARLEALGIGTLAAPTRLSSVRRGL